MKSPEADLQEQQQNLGVTAAQGQVSGLRGAIANTTSLLNQVAPSVMGRTANSLVTSAQADQQIGNEQAPLNTQLNTENTQYSNANQDYTNLEQRAESLANADETGQQNQESYLQNIYNNLYTQEQNSAASAEQQRVDNANIAATNRSGTTTTTPSLVGGSGATTGGATTIGNLAKNAVGGYAVTDGSGKPITLGQYVDMNGGGVQQVIQLLSQGSAQDQALSKNIETGLTEGLYNQQNLAQQYPQIFGG